ncbi:hypothetical protein B0T22DRAFT_224909 [Podospora appendiculata]|uniref:Uncharacterized protein n=1 Tax=Podospora appendiculata TaxID=314037 RepID=A0AAE1CAL4_9PEZI|nr:hypothetical protein B0T22DRAFT_224909 [Podospora appendiculata]
MWGWLAVSVVLIPRLGSLTSFIVHSPNSSRQQADFLCISGWMSFILLSIHLQCIEQHASNRCYFMAHPLLLILRMWKSNQTKWPSYEYRFVDLPPSPLPFPPIMSDPFSIRGVAELEAIQMHTAHTTRPPHTLQYITANRLGHVAGRGGGRWADGQTETSDVRLSPRRLPLAPEADGQ